MSKEKRMLGNYEITQSIYIGDKEVLFGVDQKMPFLWQNKNERFLTTNFYGHSFV